MPKFIIYTEQVNADRFEVEAATKEAAKRKGYKEWAQRNLYPKLAVEPKE